MSRTHSDGKIHPAMRRSMALLVGTVLFALSPAACGVEDEFQRIADELNTGYIEGRTETSDTSRAPAMAPMAEASGDVAVAGRIDSSGSFIEKGRSSVDASGHYEIGVDVTEGAMSDLVVRIESEGDAQGSVIVSGKVSAGTTVQAAPINTETTVEAEAYASARSEGHWEDREGSTALFRAHISAEVAADVKAGGDYEGDIVALGKAASAAIHARSEAFLDARSSTSEAELEAALEAMTEAQSDLDASLHAAADARARAEARADFEDALTNAYASASIDVEQRSRAAHAGAEAFLVLAANLSADAQAGATAESESLRAQAVASLVEAQAVAAGLQAEGQAAVETAIATLHSELEAAAQAGAQAEADIRAAWADFSATIVAELEASMDGAEQTAFESVETIVVEARNTLDQALSLIGTVSADAAAEAAASAVLDGYADITADSTITVMTEAGMDGVRAEAVVEIFAAASLAAR